MQKTAEIVILGGGVAGLTAALAISEMGRPVLVLTKDSAPESSTDLAQGGVAVVFSDEDRVESHVDDTLAAGAGLNHLAAVRLLVAEGADAIRRIIHWGAEFDQEDGKIALTREAAHTHRRIVHARGDATGQEIMRCLLQQARAQPNISLLPRTFATRLVTAGGRITGVEALRADGARLGIGTSAVILATGGVGRLFRESTNPPLSTGDGLALAAAAGAPLMNLEFVQFHPTALYLPGRPRFLITEAARGEGGILRNHKGEAFMGRYHSAAELAPRDIVSRAILLETQRTKSDRITLDLTHLDPDFVRRRFPRIYQTLLGFGLDITSTPIPVSPAAHYHMGGVAVDLDGQSGVPGLFAAGEVSCSGVQGANRLASNSLLEGMVFGWRCGIRAAVYARDNGVTPVAPPPPAAELTAAAEAKFEAARKAAAELMWDHVGLVRDAAGLQRALEKLQRLAHGLPAGPLPRRAVETWNMLTLSAAIAGAALHREESRGAHFRADHSGTVPALARPTVTHFHEATGEIIQSYGDYWRRVSWG
jgi:L-aspartate oxidase